MAMRKRTFTGSTSAAVTQRELDNRVVARVAAAEGIVLLKNEAETLPIPKGTKLALYGPGAVCTVKGGTGSGDVNCRDTVSIADGLKNAGYEITTQAWLDSYVGQFEAARLAWRDQILGATGNDFMHFFQVYADSPFLAPAGDPLDVEKCKADGADTAIYVLRRIAGEAADRKTAKGDYYLTDEELAMVEQICQAYEKVVLVLNVGSIVDLSFTEKLKNITAIVYFVQGGQEGGNALADILSGKVSPSGKLTDTWAANYSDYPSAATFSAASGSVYKEEYVEGIYVGYRYFDTFDVPVQYCFGHGLSYTDFDIRCGNIHVSGLGSKTPKMHVDVTVTNTGDTYSGKEVVQVYVSCPQGKLHKECRRLCGFAKTGMIAPGKSETLTVSFPLYQMASYCEAQNAWVLEAGSYGIWTGNSLDTATLAGSAKLDADAVLVKCQTICPRQEPLEELKPDPEKMAAKQAVWQAQAKDLPCVEISAGDILSDTVEYAPVPEQLPGEAGRIVEALSVDQLVALATGDPGMGQGSALGSAGQTVPGAAAETVASVDGVASIVLADGPAGIRLSKTYQVHNGAVVKGEFMDAIENGFFAKEQEKVGTTYYQYSTAIPVGTVLAQTWNTALLKQVGEMIGHEMELFEVTLWLAPGMNIHRNPLCGRNFEYYSEDPLLSGAVAAAMTQGVQTVPGCGTTVKHFACNNQEDNRMGSDSVITQRTLREIYLKGFEIAVKTSQPMSIMTSYNLINGVHAANSYDLCTKAARDEWGFAGAIMTDWTTTTNSTAGECTAAGCMKAGNDMVMPGDPSDHASIRAALESGALDIRELKRCVYNTVKIILQSNQYENPVSYLAQFPELND